MASLAHWSDIHQPRKPEPRMTEENGRRWIDALSVVAHPLEQVGPKAESH